MNLLDEDSPALTRQSDGGTADGEGDEGEAGPAADGEDDDDEIRCIPKVMQVWKTGMQYAGNAMMLFPFFVRWHAIEYAIYSVKIVRVSDSNLCKYQIILNKCLQIEHQAYLDQKEWIPFITIQFC